MLFERQIAFIGIHIALLPKLHSTALLLETVGSDEVIVVAKAKVEGKSPPLPPSQINPLVQVRQRGYGYVRVESVYL